jgi:hypothetical protein
MNKIITLKSWGGVGCIILLASLPIKSMSADFSRSRDVKVTWMPDIQTGHIILEITNKGEASVFISPYLNMIYRLSEKDDLSSLLTVSEPKTIAASVVIMEPHPKDLVQIPSERGQLPKPIEVGVGETKRIQFLADENLITLTKAKHSTTAGLYLFLDGKPISITPVMISDGSWK